MKNGFISKTQIGNLSKLSYDIGKLLVGGGIITPYLTKSDGNIDLSAFGAAGICFVFGLILDAIYDRMI